MKSINVAAMAALLTSSFIAPTAPAVAGPLPATDANAPTTAEMQQYCDNQIATTQADPTVWRATVSNAASDATTPTEVAGTERSINFRADEGSTFTYAGFLYPENPLTRTGGSPNMWGQSVFSQKIWDNTLYDVEMQFTHDVTYTWTCDLEEYVTTTRIVGGGNDGDNGGGSGNNGRNNGDNLQTGGNGNGNNGCGNGNSGPIGDNPNSPPGCNGGREVTTSEWVNRDDEFGTHTNTDIDDGYDVTATALQQLGQVVGVNYTVLGTYRPAGVRTLACISPGRKGGTWTPKHGYTGGQCSTITFNAAPTVEGREFDPISSNSLPAQ